MKKMIAHRGNLNGPSPTENTIDQIYKVIFQTPYDVEIDLWFDDLVWFLGHDYPQQVVDFQHIINNRDRLWIHCKNPLTMAAIQTIAGEFEKEMNYFYHDKDFMTLTSKKYMWVHPNGPIVAGSIIVMPENRRWAEEKFKKDDFTISKGVCTDFPERYEGYYK